MQYWPLCFHGSSSCSHLCQQSATSSNLIRLVLLIERFRRQLFYSSHSKYEDLLLLQKSNSRQVSTIPSRTSFQKLFGIPLLGEIHTICADVSKVCINSKLFFPLPRFKLFLLSSFIFFATEGKTMSLEFPFISCIHSAINLGCWIDFFLKTPFILGVHFLRFYGALLMFEKGPADF